MKRMIAIAIAIALVLSMVEVTWASPKQAQHMQECIQLRNEIHQARVKLNVIKRIVDNRCSQKTIAEAHLKRLIDSLTIRTKEEGGLVKEVHINPGPKLVQAIKNARNKVEELDEKIDSLRQEAQMLSDAIEEMQAKFNSNCKR